MGEPHSFFTVSLKPLRTLYIIVVAGLLITAIATYAQFSSKAHGEFYLYSKGVPCKIYASNPLSLAAVSIERNRLELFFYRSYVLSNFSQVMVKVRDRCLNVTIMIVKRRAAAGEIFGFGIDLGRHKVECLELYGFVGSKLVLKMLWPFDC